MNPKTLQQQQTASNKWMFTHSPEIKDFWPQETFQDLTDFHIPVDPTWDKGKYSNEREPEDTLFSSSMKAIEKKVKKNLLEQIGNWKKRVDAWQAKCDAFPRNEYYKDRLETAKKQLQMYKRKL